MGFFSNIFKNAIKLPIDAAEGVTREMLDQPPKKRREVKRCPECGGKCGTGFGRVAGQECPICKGTGKVNG